VRCGPSYFLVAFLRVVLFAVFLAGLRAVLRAVAFLFIAKADPPPSGLVEG